MKYLCPLCGNNLVTEDLHIYTCVNCDETFTSDELNNEYGLDSNCIKCQVNND